MGLDNFEKSLSRSRPEFSYYFSFPDDDNQDRKDRMPFTRFFAPIENQNG